MISIPDTARLRFTLLGMQDAELLYEVDQDEEVMRYLNGGKRSSMADIEQTMLPRIAKYLDPALGFGIWQVRRLSDQAYLGWVLIRLTLTSTSPSLKLQEHASDPAQ
ncbi:hypothetical protein ABC502_04260 [Alkalimonas sp. NCh-2]|uniref:GNAT family N-acetyltransferase n=1 Tax=Alkalimonas sp. NCh-2 TaxID=3144846 RepID=UPI0031F6608F